MKVNAYVPREAGTPVRACFGRLFAGKNAEGQQCLYAMMSQHSGAGTMFILQIDLETGACRRFDGPPGTNDARNGLWSERRQCLFGYTATGVATPGILTRLDPQKEYVENLGTVHAKECYMPCSIAEAPDGTLYLGSCSHNCALSSYDPATGAFTQYGKMDETDMYFYVQCGADGTVAGMVRMSYPHVVAINPETGEHKTVGPVADINAGTGRVALVKGIDGFLYIDSHEGCFRILGMDLEYVEKVPEPEPRPTLPDGSTYDFIDTMYGWKIIAVTKPDGTQRVYNLDYEAAGTEIYITRPGPDGKLYGSSVLPLRFFRHDPKTGESVDFGQSTTSSGEIYSLDSMNGKLYFCSYTHGILSVYDPNKPHRFGPMVPGRPGVLRQGRSVATHSHRFQYDENDNPKQLGRMDDVACRPRDMCAGPAGKVWVASVPDYGLWGGTLSWYDPATDTFGGRHRGIFPDCSPYCLTYMPEADQLVIGFSIYAGSGTEPRARTTGFALWDPQTDSEVWKGDFGLEIIGVMDVEYAGGNQVYAIIHPAPADVLKAELLLLDFAEKKIVSRARLDNVAGWPLEVSFQRDDTYLYGATRTSVYRARLGTTDIELLWSDPKDGPDAGGALVDGSYYFSTAHRLRAIDLGQVGQALK